MECRYCTKNPNYLVFADGRIYSIKTQIWRSCSVGTHGYLRVTLPHEGKKLRFDVHRLVAEAFLPNPDGKCDVNHKNGIKTDNRVENLEWVTRSENILHAMDNGLNKRRIPVGMYATDGVLIRTFPSAYEAERQTGVANNHIRQVCKGKRKTAGGYMWRDLR